MQTLTQRRSVPVDAAKTAAIFGTLLIHASAAGGFAGAPGSFGWTSALFWNCLLRSAVPVFFLCSGALLLPPQLCHVLSVIQAPCLMLCFSAAAEQQMVFEFPPLQNTPAWPLLLLIRSEQTARNAKTPLLQALLLQMSALSPTSLAPSPSGGSEFPLPFAMLQHLNAHFTEDLSLSELSEQFHVSTSHMIHVFKAQFGLTPIQYVIRRRIGEAQHLLRTTEDSAGDIAGRVGMVNRNYFYRMFKRLVELSPVQYREVTCGQLEEHASR